MAFEPHRFIHAANIRLDVPVSVQTSDVLTDELRLAFEDATLTSFDDVIQACMARRVDYLLLSGNVFIEADRSLRARLALLNGFRQLEAKQIRVFVLPGDADPAEAWRAIPEMPANVQVCYSSNPEPAELIRGDRVVATVSASVWYGETDAFGIRVIAEHHNGVRPFRIGAVSQARYEEARRMAALAATASTDMLSATLQNSALAEKTDDEPLRPHGRLVALTDRPLRRPADEADLGDLEDEESVILPGVPPQGAHSGDHAVQGEEPESDVRDWESGFVAWVDELLREGQLNYLALTGELERSTLARPLGQLHCPGTTQPRDFREAVNGCCSLVEVSADGRVQISAIDTSSIDWKDIEILVASRTTLSSMLQTMKTRLLQHAAGPSDRIWSVHWTLRCSMPVLHDLMQDDLATAVAVELDELTESKRTIRLLHHVQLVPDEWNMADEKCLAQRYSGIVSDPQTIDRERLQRLLDEDRELTVGWKQRLGSLIAGMDTEQVLARLRIDGAGWFIPDLSVLLDESGTDEAAGGDDELTDEDGSAVLRDDEYGDESPHSVYADDGDDEEEFADDPPDDESGRNSSSGKGGSA